LGEILSASTSIVDSVSMVIEGQMSSLLQGSQLDPLDTLLFYAFVY